jgi:hypothetical protein
MTNDSFVYFEAQFLCEIETQIKPNIKLLRIQEKFCVQALQAES